MTSVMCSFRMKIINALGQDQTHIHTVCVHIYVYRLVEPKQVSETKHMPSLKNYCSTLAPYNSPVYVHEFCVYN